MNLSFYNSNALYIISAFTLAVKGAITPEQNTDCFCLVNITDGVRSWRRLEAEMGDIFTFVGI